MSGITSYHAGLAAEASVARHLADRGLQIVARRWRGRWGEIDLVARDGEMLVLVEVKKSGRFAEAAARLSRAQLRRIWATAAEFLAGQPAGQSTNVRLDLALVDGTGRIEMIENITLD